MEMEIRELTEGDIPALTELCSAALPYDTFTPELLRRRTLGDPEYAQRYQLCAFAGGRLAAAAVGVRRSAPAGAIGGLLLFAVAPELRRGKAATRLLDAVEGRMREDGLAKVVVGGTPPNFFWAGVDMRYTPAYCLLEARGYRITDVRVNQLVDLRSSSWETEADEARLRAEGIVVRRAAESDREGFGAWLRERWSPSWFHEAMNSYANDPVTTFVAERDGAVCSFATYNSAGFAGHFGPTGTEESQRGRGIARVLFYRCMRDMRAAGLERSEVVWVGPIAFYTRVAGAYVHRAFWAMEKAL